MVVPFTQSSNESSDMGQICVEGVAYVHIYQKLVNWQFNEVANQQQVLTTSYTIEYIRNTLAIVHTTWSLTNLVRFNILHKSVSYLPPS